MTGRDLDLVVFGATSFVGRILCQRLVERMGPDRELRWAIAGRNPVRLDEVASSTEATPEVIVADAADRDAMRSLAEASRVVVSTVGPYARYGSELVAAVAASGTDYCDLTGEPQWMRAMIDAHQETAAASGARIVHACGFDSIPSDLGVWFTQREAQSRFGEPCQRLGLRLESARGGASGGTIASLLDLIDQARRDPALREELRNPFSLAPDGLRQGHRQPEVRRPQLDDLSGSWVAPFVMAAPNTRVVHRTHALLGRPWGEDFEYDEAMVTGGGVRGIAMSSAVTAGIGGLAVASQVPPTRWLLDRLLPSPGSGPSVSTQERGFFDVRFHGRTASGRQIVTRVTGDRDPGYGSTAKMLAEAALTFGAVDRTSVGGGFWTPATMFGDLLIDRLVAHAGLTFEVLSTT